MRTGNGMNFGRIAAVAPGMTYEYVATATNGYILTHEDGILGPYFYRLPKKA